MRRAVLAAIAMSMAAAAAPGVRAEPATLPALPSEPPRPPDTVGTVDVSDPGCRDVRRRLVRLVVVPDLGDAGRAEFAGGSPVIKIDPAIMAGLPTTLQTFFKLHECAHHVLGHLFAPTLESEKEADCWAMREGLRRKAFAAADVDAWRPYLVASRGSRWGHLPGPQRLTFLARCVETDTE
jgi:hypothetical protein